MIEMENKKGCKAAVHGLLLFLSYYNRILSTYDEVFEVALALTKYTRPEKVEVSHIVYIHMINAFFRGKKISLFWLTLILMILLVLFVHNKFVHFCYLR